MPGRVPPRRGVLAVMAMATASWLALWWWPPASRASRALMLLMALVVVAGAMRLLWARRVLRFLPGALVLAPLVVLVLPGRAHDAAALGQRYLRALRSYEGTRYVWGGESHRGIDCSGLVRRALRDAALGEGARTMNPALLRLAADLWWNDASARALGEGHRGLTREVASGAGIRALAQDAAAPGDLAVTTDGVHVLAALPAGAWIEADPTLGRVVVLGPGNDSPWLHARVRVVRWRALEAP